MPSMEIHCLHFYTIFLLNLSVFQYPWKIGLARKIRLVLRAPHLTRVYHSFSWCIVTTNYIHEARFFSITLTLKSFLRACISQQLTSKSLCSSRQLLIKVSKCIGESCTAVLTWILNTFLAPSFSVVFHNLPKWLHFQKTAVGQFSVSSLFGITLLLLTTLCADDFLHALSEHILCWFIIWYHKHLFIRNNFTSCSEARQWMHGFSRSNPYYAIGTSSFSRKIQQYETVTGKQHTLKQFPTSI